MHCQLDSLNGYLSDSVNASCIITWKIIRFQSSVGLKILKDKETMNFSYFFSAKVIKNIFNILIKFNIILTKYCKKTAFAFAIHITAQTFRSEGYQVLALSLSPSWIFLKQRHTIQL